MHMQQSFNFWSKRNNVESFDEAGGGGERREGEKEDVGSERASEREWEFMS